jgi:hypothetical protein
VESGGAVFVIDTVARPFILWPVILLEESFLETESLSFSPVLAFTCSTSFCRVFTKRKRTINVTGSDMIVSGEKGGKYSRIIGMSTFIHFVSNLGHISTICDEIIALRCLQSARHLCILASITVVTVDANATSYEIEERIQRDFEADHIAFVRTFGEFQAVFNLLNISGTRDYLVEVSYTTDLEDAENEMR